jgi:hypothetical protein
MMKICKEQTFRWSYPQNAQAIFYQISVCHRAGVSHDTKRDKIRENDHKIAQKLPLWQKKEMKFVTFLSHFQ